MHTIIIQLNGEPQTITAPCKLAHLLNSYFQSSYPATPPTDLEKIPFAVMLNGTFTPKSEHSKIRLNANDTVDIFTAMQGG